MGNMKSNEDISVPLTSNIIRWGEPSVASLCPPSQVRIGLDFYGSKDDLEASFRGLDEYQTEDDNRP